MERFQGRVAVVTGASSGIGAEMAQELVRSGLVVVAVARRLDRLKTLAESLKGAKGRLEPFQADVSSVDEVRRLFQWVDSNLGGVTIMINNAAVMANLAMQNLQVEELQTLVNTNILAVLVGCKEAINSMQKHNIKDGHIININSIAGHKLLRMPSAEIESITAYTASKFSITGLSQGLRPDLQRIPGFKTRVTNISPGTVLTEMVPQEVANLLPDPTCILTPKDVCNAVMWAISCPPSVEITELTIQATGEAF